MRHPAPVVREDVPGAAAVVRDVEQPIPVRPVVDHVVADGRPTADRGAVGDHDPARKGARGRPAASFNVDPGKAPFSVNTYSKVAKLNADRLDGLDASAFLLNQAPLNLVGGVDGSGVIAADNTGNGNGLQGRTNALGASGVYGENNGGGFGVAGRSNEPDGFGVYGEATDGWAGYFTGPVHLGGGLDCAGCVSTGNLAPGTAASVGGYVIVTAHSTHDNVVRTERQINADCPLGTRAIGGRGDVQEGAVGTKAALVASDPSLYVPPNGDPPFATGWFVKGKAMQDNHNTRLDVSAYAIYAFVSQ